MENKRDRGGAVFLMLWAAYAAVYVGRKNFSVLMAAMTAEGVIDKLTGGSAGTAFLAVYACGQLVNGIIGDRVSPALMISAGLFGAALANAAMGLVASAAAVPFIWGVCGFFCSMLWPAVVRCMAEWLDSGRRTAAGTNIQTTLPIGSVASYGLCALALRFFGWRQGFFLCAGVLAAAGAAFAIFYIRMRGYIKKQTAINRSSGQKTKQNQTDGKDGRIKGLLVFFITSGLAWAGAGIIFNGILKDGLDLWAPTCVTEFYKLSASAASVLTGLMPAVSLAGVYFAQRIFNRYLRDELSCAAAMFGIAAAAFIPLLILIFRGGSGLLEAAAAVLLMAIIFAAMLGANSMLVTFIPMRYAGSGRSSSISGLLNSLSYAAASLSGVTIGFISERWGWTPTLAAFAACSLSGCIVCMAGARRTGGRGYATFFKRK